MKPGKPLLYSRIADKPVIGLPGNPVSTMVSFEQFVRPLLKKNGGLVRFNPAFAKREGYSS